MDEKQATYDNELMRAIRDTNPERMTLSKDGNEISIPAFGGKSIRVGPAKVDGKDVSSVTIADGTVLYEDIGLWQQMLAVKTAWRNFQSGSTTEAQ